MCDVHPEAPVKRFIVLLSAFLAAPVVAQQSESMPTGEPIVIGQAYTLESDVLGETRRIRVSLPDGYDESEQRCGVVYLLDGDYLFTQMVGGVRHATGRAFLPLIVVGIENTDRTRDLTPEVADEKADARFPTAGGSAQFRRFLVDELQPYIDANYRTNSIRILVGHSFGGLFAFETMLEEPEAFSAYFVLSPSLWFGDEALLAKQKETPTDSAMYDRYVYLAMGEEGEIMNPPFEEAVWHFNVHAPARFRWDVGRFPGQDHWMVAHQAMYSGVLAYIAPCEEALEGVATMAELDARFEALTEIYGEKIPLAGAQVGEVAFRLRQRGDIDAAMELLGAGLMRFPKEARMYLFFGDLLEEHGRVDEAIAVYERGVAVFSGEDAGAEGEEIAGMMRARAEAARGKLKETE
jgi:predicted alpha/beta superfamily hydrolase